MSSAAMFGSGSEQVNPTQYDLLARIASELNRVPGRVMVLGHTDDQPIKSPRFKDNFDLSQQRAQNVAAVLGRSLSDSRRMEVTGAGDSQPIALPPGDPANRARNRRVEIVLIPET
jgi:type VI secretion system protein ImpK